MRALVGFRAGLVVDATHGRRDFTYPLAARSQVGTFARVDARGDLERSKRALAALLPDAEEVLRSGYDVLVHCEQSVHRGPVVAAAVTYWKPSWPSI